MTPPSHNPFRAAAEKRRSPVKIISIIAIVAAIAWGANHFLASGGQQAGGPPPGGGLPVEIATITPAPLNVSLSTVGTLTSDESITMRPEIAGKIETIHFEEGSAVKKGDLIISIDDDIYAAELKQAEALLTLAERNVNRVRKITKAGASSQSALDRATSEFGVAKAQYDLSKAKLDKTHLTAPFDGIIGLRKVSVGEYVNVGQDLVNLVKSDPMRVDFNISETEARALRVGQTIELQVDALPKRVFTGEVYALDPQVDLGGRSVSLRARVPNEEGLLKPGYFARVNLVLESKQAALSVPESAIVPQGNDAFAFVLDAENKVKLTKLNLGMRQKGSVEVVDGVKAGDRVVTAGQLKLHDGMPVTPIDPKAAVKATPEGQAPADAAPAADEAETKQDGAS